VTRPSPSLSLRRGAWQTATASEAIANRDRTKIGAVLEHRGAVGVVLVEHILTQARGKWHGLPIQMREARFKKEVQLRNCRAKNFDLWQ
jgi:hypothetical protein